MGNLLSQLVSTKKPALASSSSTKRDVMKSSVTPPNMLFNGGKGDVENPLQKKPSSSSPGSSSTRKKYGYIPDNFSTLDQVPCSWSS